MNKQNKISLILGVLVLTVLIVTSSFAYFQITNTDSSTNTNFSGELEDIEDYGKSVLSGGIEGYHINILASDMAPSKIGTHYYGTIDSDSNYSLERKNYEISNVSIQGGVNNANVAYTCTSELSITLEGSLTDTKEDGTYYIHEGDGTLYLRGSNLRIDKSQIDLKELIENATLNEGGIKEYKKTLTYNISKGNPGTLNVDFDIINRDTVQNDIAGKNIEITLRNSNLQCEVSGRKVYASLDTKNNSNGDTYRSSEYREKIVSASFVDYLPREEELTQKVIYWDLSSYKNNSVIGWLEATGEGTEQYNLYIGSKDNIYVTYLPYAFFSMTNLKEINFENLNTSEVTNMSSMFYGCSKLATLDLSTFDTSSVTNMSSMFKGYQGTTLDLSNFDTSKVTDMRGMFSGLTADLPFKDWPNFVTSNVEDMSSMFSTYKGTILDLSTFDTSSVTDMSSMFYQSSPNIIFQKGFGSVATNMSSMFEEYQGSTLDLSTFDTSSVTNMSSMFEEYQGSTLDLSTFDTSSVTDMDTMFSGCSNLTTLDLSSFDTSKVTEMYSMFYKYQGTTLDLSSFDTTKVTSMSNMFRNCSNLTTLDLSTFDTSSVTKMSSMFEGVTVDLPFKNWPNFVTNNVEYMDSMFSSYKGTELDLSTFDTSKVTNMSRMFMYCSNLAILDLSSFTFDNVTYVDYSFYSVPKSCQIKIKTSQKELFESKFANEYNFTPTYVD